MITRGDVARLDRCVEHERSGLACPDPALRERNAEEEVCLLLRPVREDGRRTPVPSVARDLYGPGTRVQ